MTGKITGKLVYDVLTSLLPLYVPMFAAYASIRWWKILKPEQCSGINIYVAYLVIPFFTFKFIAESDPYTMNFYFLGADVLQKVLVLAVILLAHSFYFSRRRADSFDWAITLYSLTTLPNTLVMGIPLFGSFYGEYAGQLMVQIVFLQSMIWCNSLLVLFEYRAAVQLISKKFPDNAEHIESFKVDADIASLSNVNEEVDACLTEVDEKGKMHVSLRRMNSFRMSMSLSRLSNLSVEEIYSTNSSVREMQIYSTNSSIRERPSFDHRKSNSIHMFAWNSSCRYPAPATIIPSLESSKTCNVKPFEATTSIRETERNIEEGRGEELNDVATNNKTASQSLMLKLAMTMTWRKLSRNPTTYATLLGLIWSLLANSRLQIQMPAIFQASYRIVSNGGIGMIMFTLGVFMGEQEKLIPCGKKLAALAMFVRFVISPAIIALTSLPFGLRGDLYRITILQAALPQAIMAFVYAKTYNVLPEVLSTAVSLGMLIALPISFLYFVLLGL